MGYYRGGDFLGISNWNPFSAPNSDGVSLDTRADAITRSIQGGAATMPGGAIADPRDAGWRRMGRALVPSRRMNPTNVRALRRSMRRVQSFARIAKSVMTFTHAHKMKKHHRRK